MTAITTGGSGVWSSTTESAPWVGGVVPAEGDTVIIANGHTVTIDQNITVGADTSTAAISIASGGKLELLYTVAADYTLTLKGDFKISGTLEIGTVTNSIPITRTFTIKLNYSATLLENEFGMLIGDAAAANVILQGGSRSYYATLLSSVGTSGDNHIHTAVNTGWLDNDILGLAGTTRTAADCETLVMNGNAAADVINFDSPATLAATHLGTSPMQAEVVNLTRNIKITSYDAAYNGYVTIKTAGTVINWDWVEFSELGGNTTGKHGVSFITNTLTSAADIRYCSFYNGYSGIRNGIASNKLSIQDSIFYNNANIGLDLTNGLTNSTIKNLYIGKSSNNGCYVGLLVSTTFENLYIFNSTLLGVSTAVADFSGITFTNIQVHGCGSGLQSQGYWLSSPAIIDRVVIWRNGSFGISLYYSNFIIKNIALWGNQNYNIRFESFTCGIRITGGTSDSDATFSTPQGINTGSQSGYGIVEDVIFGGSVTHTSGDLYPSSYGSFQLYAINCTLTTEAASSVFVAQQPGSVVSIHNTDGTRKIWKRQGTIESDSTANEYHTATPSEKLTPYYATEKLESNSKFITCSSGSTKTVTVWVRKAAAYDGDQPRLILKRNYAAGVTADAVLDTATEAVETWEHLSGVVTAPSEDTVYELVVDCADGTAAGHYINVDDWAVS